MSGGVWADYWARRNGAGGCLPGADKMFAPVLAKLWRDFAQQLHAGAKLVDLATGDGAVLRTIAASGRRIELLGVDSAPKLPLGPPGIRLKAGVSMEKLPFPDRSLDALTSQFGVEYGDIARIATEAGRVLKAGGRLRFVVHHRDGPVVGYNMERREALTWAIEMSGVLAKARQLAMARHAAPIATPPSFRASIAEAQRRFPRQSAAAEIHTAILNTLDMGLRHPPTETLEVLMDLEARAQNEIGRLAELERAACDAPAIAGVTEQLRSAGLEVGEPVAISAGSGEIPFAWLLDGSKMR